MTELEALGNKSRQAAAVLALCTTEEKNRALLEISRALIARKSEILIANDKDAEIAAKNGMSESMLDRLRLTAARIDAIAASVQKVAALQDPIGEELSHNTLENGLLVQKVRVPLGVIGIIFESRPNVTVDSAVLCLKSGNAAFLRGGSETINSNIALEDIMRSALCKAGLPPECVTLLHDTSRETATQMMNMRGILDVLIPRGGAGLIRAVTQKATVPVIQTGTGNCHIYVDSEADLAMACDIIYNAKTQRVSVCNAAETVLVHEAIAPALLPKLKAQLESKNVELRLCPAALDILGGGKSAAPDDWSTEFLDYILALRVVPDISTAIAHITKYSTGHSECIITNNKRTADIFTSQIDSAMVYVNASTRFTDGEELGFGAEIGISTQKMHARGPMGLRELCSYKYIIHGNGQVRK